MKKLLLRILRVLCTVCFLTGCSQQEVVPTQTSSTQPTTTVEEKPLYEISVLDGQTVLNFYDGNEYQKDESGEGNVEAIEYPIFSSYEEMVRRIKNGDFSEREVQLIKRWFPKDKNGSIKICDVDAMYVPTLPEDSTVSEIYWTGSGYTSIVLHDGGAYQSTIDVSSEAYESYYDRYVTNFEETYKTAYYAGMDADRNATVYRLNGSLYPVKFLHYTVEDGNKRIEVLEHIKCEQMEDGTILDGTVPDSVHIWVTDGTVQFYVFTFSPSQRPSMEWICSFGATIFESAKKT